MLSACERVPIAANKSPKHEAPQPVTAANPVSATPSPNDGAKSASSSTNVSIAGAGSSSTPETSASSAPRDALTSSSSSTVLRALCAESLCDSCATAIARSLALIRQGQLASRALGLPSTRDSNEQILTLNLARFAADLAKHDTTSTTTELTISFGCVVDAISTYTTRAFQHAARKLEDRSRERPASPFLYSPKAPGHERPTVDGVSHPTVKPVELIRWLIRLITPPNGTILDPFAGTGTTAEAAIHEHKRAIVIEREADYLPLIVARLSKPMAVGFDFEEPA
jgi:hypothetical protein